MAGQASAAGAGGAEAAVGRWPHPASGADALLEALIEGGVGLVFGYPGGAIMPVYDALHRHREAIRHVLVRHEQGAAHAAEGYARASGRIGVCMGTSGPGATNLLTGLADAMMDSTPMLALTGQVPSPMLGSDAFQEADVVGMSLPVTKWAYQATDPGEVGWAVRRGLAIAASGRPGPVLIDITKDAQVGPVRSAGAGGRYPAWAGRTESSPAVTSDASAVAPFDEAIEQAARLLDDAERPLLFAGQGVLIAGAEAELLAVAERADIPIACTLLGLSAAPCDHPLYVGMLGMHGNYGPNVLTNQADVILAVGMRFDDRVTGRLDGYAPNARVVHVDIDPTAIGKNVPAAVGVVADAKRALAALAPRLAPALRPRWRDAFTRCAAEEEATVTRPLLERSPDAPPSMAAVVAEVSRRTGGEAIVVSDVGQHQMHAARHYRFRHPQSHITSGGLGTMGFALPAAIGAAASEPGRTVLAIIGDGGFQMSLQELGTLAQEGLPVKVLILDNAYLGMVRQWQELFFDGRYSEVAMRNPDFVQIGAAYGLPAARVERAADLPSALERMLETPGPYVLAVAVEREENVFPMIPAGATIDDIRLT